MPIYVEFRNNFEILNENMPCSSEIICEQMIYLEFRRSQSMATSQGLYASLIFVLSDIFAFMLPLHVDLSSYFLTGRVD